MRPLSVKLAVALAPASAAALAALLAAPPAAAAPSPLVAFGFEDGAGTQATDASASGLDGTLVGGATWTPSGRHGGALCFDGASGRVDVPFHPSLNLFDRMTLSAWVRPASLGDWTTVVLRERPGGLLYALYASDGAGRPPAAYVHNGADQRARAAVALPLGAWSHLAATFGGGRLRLYVDGALVATRSFSGNVHDSTGPLRIGGNAIWGEWFHGCIDEVRVYDATLTAAELAAEAATPIEQCGDGVRTGAETCDDGNTVTEACAYGAASCVVCDASCRLGAGATSFCGDGVVDAANGEACDGFAPHATCTACALVCDAGFADCNGLAGDGCEASLSSPTSCGACGVACDGTCDGGVCVPAGCTGGVDEVGRFLQPDYSATPYAIELACAHAAAPGEVFAEVSYPSFGCAGTWTVQAVSGNSYTIVEEVDAGCISGCVYRFDLDPASGSIAGSGVSCPGYPESLAQAWEFTVCPNGGRNWDGPFLQPDYSAQPYPVSLACAAPAAPGEVFSHVSYPSFGCDGTWSVQSVAGSTLTIVETVGGGCISGCVYTFTLDEAAGTLVGHGVSCAGYPTSLAEQWSFELTQTGP